MDSGLDIAGESLLRECIRGEANRKKAFKNFAGREDDIQDNVGHGSHVAQLVLNTAPAAHIYIAKICEQEEIGSDGLRNIAKVCRCPGI